MTALYNKHRPQYFQDVIGQGPIVEAVEKAIKERDTHAFLFAGPSGVGKTTLARIGCYELGCKDGDIMEIDAATYTGVENMRSVQDVLQYKPFGTDHRGVIVDESHRLSKQAWDSLLKVIEEPPSFLTWFFCTTDPGKIPSTIKTRCMYLQLKAVKDYDLKKLLKKVMQEEQFKMDDSILELVVREARGSPRQALVNLAACKGLTKRKEAADILKTAVENDPIISLCRMLATSTNVTWGMVMGAMQKIEEQEENPEGVRIIMTNYMGAALRGAKTDKDAIHFLRILDEFADVYNPAEGMAPLYRSIGRVLFSG